MILRIKWWWAGRRDESGYQGRHRNILVDRVPNGWVPTWHWLKGAAS